MDDGGGDDAGDWLDDAVEGWPGRRRFGPEAIVILLWMGLVFALLFLLAGWRDAAMERWAAAAGPDAFRSAPADGHLFWLLLVIVFGGLAIMAARASLVVRLSGLVALLSLYVILLCLGWRATVTVSDGAVTIRPIVPGLADTRFALADATVVARGCAHGREEERLVFRLRHGRHAVDLGRDVGADDAARWLRAIAPYADGRLPLPAAAREGVAHDGACLAAEGRLLDEGQRAVLMRLVG